MKKTNNREVITFKVEPRFPYRICDMTLPDCNTGFVYFLVSCRIPEHSYIGQKSNVLERVSTNIIADTVLSLKNLLDINMLLSLTYICGFNGSTRLLLYAEKEWNIKREILQKRGINRQKQWARCVQNEIESIDELNFNSRRETNPLRLILLF